MAKKTDSAKIEFPCPDFPIKVLGQSADDYHDFVVEIVQIHAPDLEVERIKVNESSNGRFTSLTMYITATGPEQLKAIHEDLIKHDRVKMVM